MDEAAVDDNPTPAGAGTALPEIPGYDLTRVIGQGGMSTVYLARQRSLGRDVAIKVMLPAALADEVSRRRFENEVRTIARLEHPHIVGIFEVGRTRDGLPYYAMPYLARGHLGQRDLTRDHARVRSTLRALLSALEFAHGRGVIHRDVKAENVLFDEAERPLLADFGIALRKGFGPRVTTAGLAVGSTAYMAPEQARGDDVDHRADLYSVGVLAWELLTGGLPFNAGDALSMAVMHAQDPVPRLPPALRHWQRFLDKALAKTPAQRFATARQMLEALDRVPAAPAHPRAGLAASLQRHAGALRRVPRTAWVGALLVAAGLVGAWLRDDSDAGESFFRAQPAAVAMSPATVPVPGDAPPAGVLADDPTHSMLRAAPESAAERWVIDAERQLRQRRLHAPRGDNAFDSLLAAWETDPTHVRLPATIAALLAAYDAEAGRQLARGDDAAAGQTLARALDLATRTDQQDQPALATMRNRTGLALAERVATAETRMDRQAALAAAELHGRLRLDPRASAALLARARKIPKAGQRVPGDPAGAVIVRSGERMLAVGGGEVTRAEYGRFAAATGRAPALCRERASLLRLVKPRSWLAPGFEQSDGEAVVCVSWSDGEAYARWMSQRSGQRYRLPSAAESDALPQANGNRAIAEWLVDCSGSCASRLTTGASWRGATGRRPLEADRGYDDVGFRLVREL